MGTRHLIHTHGIIEDKACHFEFRIFSRIGAASVFLSIRNGINANHETSIPEDFRSEVRPLLIVARTQTCGARFILSHAKGEWWRISIITVMWLRVCSSFTVRSSGLSLTIGRDVNEYQWGT